MLRVLPKRLAAMRIHTSAVRAASIQDLYVKEISAFKPKPASAKEATEATKAWAIPKPPTAPSVEGDASAVAEYAEAPVEVAAQGEAATSTGYEGDWFPIPEDPVEEHH